MLKTNICVIFLLFCIDLPVLREESHLLMILFPKSKRLGIWFANYHLNVFYFISVSFIKSAFPTRGALLAMPRLRAFLHMML